MRKLWLRVVLPAALAMGGVLAPSSPAWADHTGFSKDEYEVVEGADYVELSVETTFCCPVPQGQIDYYTSNSSAIAGQDYQQTSGTLTFAGSGGQTIRVPVINDELFEGEEQFAVTLTNYRGTFLNRGRTNAVVRILDDDPKPAFNPSSSERTIQQTPATSSALSQERSGTQSIGTAGDPVELTRATSEGPLTDDSAVRQDEADPLEAIDDAPSTTPPKPASPIVSLTAIAILLALAAGILLVLRRRKGPVQ